VGLSVAVALSRQQQKAALPVLVDLLADLPREQLGPAEEVLVRLAGEKAPSVSLGTNESTRKACRDAWARWLAQNGSKIDLSLLEKASTQLGYTLLVQQKPIRGRAGVCTVIELDAARKPRWQIELPTFPVDAQVVGTERVLIAEFTGGCVSERDFKGNVKWQQQVGGNPISAQRLANGNTFVATQNRLVEYNKKGEEVFSHQGNFLRARKANNGDVIYITNPPQLVRLDGQTHQQIKSVSLGNAGGLVGLFGRIDVLPNGHVLVPHYHSRQVVEYDRDGNQVGKAFSVLQTPNSVVRLPNGNTLVGSTAAQVAEYDRAGQQIWVYHAGGQLFNVYRR
jgi:hypothetical protein